MPRQRKYRQGEVIRDPAYAVALVEQGRWLYWHHKPLHPGWVVSMPLMNIISACRKGIIRLAEPNEEKEPT